MTDAEADALAFAMSQPAALNPSQAVWLLVALALAIFLGWMWVEGE